MQVRSNSPTLPRWLLVLCLLTVMALALTSGLHAQESEGSQVLRLQWGTFDPTRGDAAPPSGEFGLDNPAASRYQIVQFTGPVEESWKSDLAASGFEPLIYVPDNAFIVRVAAGANLADAAALPFVRWIGAYYPAYKVSPNLLDASTEAAEYAVAVDVLGFPGEDVDALAKAIADLGATVVSATDDGWGPVLRVQLPSTAVADVARLEAVQWFEPVYPMKLANDVGRNIITVNTAWSRLAGQGVNLYGNGQIVAVADTGLDTGSLGTINQDFAGRVVATYPLGRPGDWSDHNAHGTHVAGSVLGNGRNSGSNPATHSYASSFAGAAPEARLVFQSLQDAQGGLGGIPSNLNSLFTPPYNDGARLHTNSWGGPTGIIGGVYQYGGYTTSAQQVDQFTWSHKDMVVLFAAGNEGTDGNYNGVVDPDSIGSPGTSKNSITVGASENQRSSGGFNPGGPCYLWGNCWPNDYPVDPIRSDRISDNPQGLAAFSSRGPTDDGRIKPEIVAPGTNIVSVRSHGSGAGTGWGVYNSNYIYEGGTSMATPLTAGATTLVRQWLQSVRNVSNPPAALVKAVLLNGARNIAPGQYGTGSTQEIPNSRPNNVTGWGRVDIANAVVPESPLRIQLVNDTGGISTGQTKTYQFTINNALEALPVEDAAVVTGPKPIGPDQAPTIPMKQVEEGERLLPIVTAAAQPETEMLGNPGFEQGPTVWTSTGPYPIIRTAPDIAYVHSGNWGAWLGGYHNADDQLFQQVSVPSSATAATLGFWLYSITQETGSGYDSFTLQIIDPVTGSHYVDAFMIDAYPATNSWQYKTYTLTSSQLNAIKGKTVRVRFRVVTDFSQLSSFYIDDVSFDVGGGPVAQRRGFMPLAGRDFGRPTGGTGPLSVTLVWTDYPGNPGASRTLVNDLDLEVVSPSGAVYRGNGSSADRVNVIESVFLDGAASGRWTVRVKGYNVPQGSQPFAVAVTGKNLTNP